MQKLKLTFWTGGSKPELAITYLGVAYDCKSFAAMEKAVRAGCFGPMSKSTFFCEYVTDTVRKDRLFQRNGSRLEAVVPLDVAINWQLSIGSKSARPGKKRSVPFNRTYSPDLFKVTWPGVFEGLHFALLDRGIGWGCVVSVMLNRNNEIRLLYATDEKEIVGRMGDGNETFISYLEEVTGMIQ